MREARDIMADLAATGLTADQAALLMELSAAVAVEARPVEDKVANRRRAKDRAYQAERRQNRQKSADAPPIEVIHTPSVSSEPDGSTETPTTPQKPNGKVPPAVSPEQVIEAWNAMADESGVHKAKLTPDRRRKLTTFIRRHRVDEITEAIWAVPRSPFLCGENDRGWKAGIDFILQPSSFTKLIEGTYERSTH